MKVQSPDLPHKTEIGGVKLNINSADEVSQAYVSLHKAGVQHTDQSRLRGILVQAMGDRGHELIIGTVNDPVVGPLVLVGFGGIAVELYRDVTYRIAPINKQGAVEMIERLKSSALLKGFRGQAVIDLDPIAELIAAVSQIAWELRDVIDEFELNPVIVRSDGLTIADALMRKHAVSSLSLIHI